MEGNSLVAQWLGLQASTAGGMGSIPGWGTKIPQAPQHRQKKKVEERRKYCGDEEERKNKARSFHPSMRKPALQFWRACA